MLQTSHNMTHMQALKSYEDAAKLQGGADLSQKITSLKKAIRKGPSKASPKAADNSTGSSFAFGTSNGSDAASEQQKSRITTAPTVGEVKDDKDYEEAKKSMVSLTSILCAVARKGLHPHKADNVCAGKC